MSRSFPDPENQDRNSRSVRRPAPSSRGPAPDDDEELSPYRSGSKANRGSRSVGSSAQPGGLLNRFNSYVDSKMADATVQPIKVEPGRRLIALGIDFGAAFLIAMVAGFIPLQHFLTQGLVIPVVMCMRDFLFGGRGIGKNFMGLRVVDMRTGHSPSFVQVLIRNAIYLGPLVFLQLVDPLLHLITVNAILLTLKGTIHGLVSLYVLVIVPYEAYRSYSREDSMRLGDALAGTCLVDADMNFTEMLPR
ncbi:MAG: RDD family protein [Candidatus Melainabacteria bacterium]|nr:RDD family protein [Candidatus Melainabacteria bacterium]